MRSPGAPHPRTAALRKQTHPLRPSDRTATSDKTSSSGDGGSRGTSGGRHEPLLQQHQQLPLDYARRVLAQDPLQEPPPSMDAAVLPLSASSALPDLSSSALPPLASICLDPPSDSVPGSSTSALPPLSSTTGPTRLDSSRESTSALPPLSSIRLEP